MNKTLQEIAEYLGGEVRGDGTLRIVSLAGIQDAGPGQLSFVANDRYAALAKRSKASALIVPRRSPVEGFSCILVDDPARAWERMLDLVRPAPVRIPPGVHPNAAVSAEAHLEEGVTVMAFAYVAPGARVAEGTVIYPGAYVGHESRIGRACVIHPNAVIRERVTLGDRVIVHAGAVIGSDGFGYAEEGGRRIKQEQFGTVVLEDDVEVGANATIDRARFDATRIGRGTKIDNLVQIAHNVVTGEHCIFISQTGIAGSVRIGKNVILAGQVGVAGHLEIGDNVTVAAKGGVTKSVPAHSVLYGNPAGDYSRKRREVAAQRRLPGLFEKVKALSERLSRLEAQSENHQKPR